MVERIIKKGGSGKEISVLGTGADTDRVVREVTLPPGLGSPLAEPMDSPESREIGDPGFDFSETVLKGLPLVDELKAPLPPGYEWTNRFYAAHPKGESKITAMGIRFPVESEEIPETLSEPLAQLREEAILTDGYGSNAELTARTIKQSGKHYLELSMTQWGGIDGPAETAFANCANNINTLLKQE